MLCAQTVMNVAAVKRKIAESAEFGLLLLFSVLYLLVLATYFYSTLKSKGLCKMEAHSPASSLSGVSVESQGSMPSPLNSPVRMSSPGPLDTPSPETPRVTEKHIRQVQLLVRTTVRDIDRSLTACEGWLVDDRKMAYISEEFANIKSVIEKLGLEADLQLNTVLETTSLLLHQ